jgi:hypothetical protein
MAPPTRSPRKGKRLLVAAVGVATVSFVSSQGCEPHTETFTSGNLLPAPPYEAGISPVTSPDAADHAPLDASGPLPTSGNLLPPQPLDASQTAMDAAHVAASTHDSSLPTTGNLLPPPRDAAIGDAAIKDAGRPILPPSGNLVPAPPMSAQEKAR